VSHHRGAVHNADGKFFGKNTIDLQWKMRANYNAGLCASLRKAAGARSIAINGKNNSQNNRKQSEFRRHALARPAAALASCLMGCSPTGARLPFDEFDRGSKNAAACGPWRLNETPAGEQRRAASAQIQD
jgi:hypothetical protein